MKFTNLLLLFLIFSCTNTDSSDQTSLDKPANPAPTLIEDALLKKAKANLSYIDQKDFEAIPYNEANFRNSKNICEQSKGYNKDIWEGLNECSWAVEKERIQAFENLVSRDGDQLILKTKAGALSLEHKTINAETKNYIQFKSYIKKANYYLIEEIKNNTCPSSKLISYKDGSQFPLTGAVIFANDEQHLLVFNSQTASNTCHNKLELYSINQEGLTKLWHFPLKNRKIRALKFHNPKEVYLSLQAEEKSQSGDSFIKIAF